MDVFNRCFLVQLQKYKQILKEINRLLSKGLLNIYFRVTIEKN